MKLLITALRIAVIIGKFIQIIKTKNRNQYGSLQINYPLNYLL